MTENIFKAPYGIKTPEIGQFGYRHGYRSQTRSHLFEGGQPHVNTFEVVEEHNEIENGISFNVETVPEPLELHLNKEKCARDSFLSGVRRDAAAFYTQEYQKEAKKHNLKASRVNQDSIDLEAVSIVHDDLVYIGADGFFQAAVCAFAQHLPLAIAPDDIWTLISYAFGRHVDNHAEELRGNFVKHQGKKRIMIDTGSSFKMSRKNQPDTGSTPEEWERIVFHQFSEKLREHIGDKVHEAIVSDFSTTSTAERAASEISLMSSMKHYFSFGMGTMCGIPNISLLGSRADWEAIRDRAEALGNLMTADFSSYWMPILLPVLDNFLDSYDGHVNHSFWQTMVKLRDTGGGSGSYSFISGWIQILFPYLSRGSLNASLRPWHELYFFGPKPGEIPQVISSCPVDWKYLGKPHDLHFHAGFAGFSQDKDGRLKAQIAWYVTHDPSKKPEVAIFGVQAEIKALLLGHTEDVANNNLAGDWYRRVKDLLVKENILLEQLPVNIRETALAVKEERPSLG